MSAFKDGVDGGLGDFKSYNSDLAGVSLGTDPSGFARVGSLADRAAGFISRMRSGFDRIGEKLHDDARSWAEGQKRRLLDGCDGMETQAGILARRADEAREAAEKVSDIGDPGDDEDKKSRLEDARERLTEATRTLRDQIDMVRGGLNAFYDTLRDVNAQFKNAIALARNGVDNSQAPLDQALNAIRGLEDQVTGKAAEEKALLAQRDAHTRSYSELTARIEDKARAEADADRALAEGARKDPPLSPADLQSLEQASAAARQAREQAESERSTFWLQTMKPAEDVYWAKVSEATPLRQQLASLKQRRDTLMNGLNAARTALVEFGQEYEEPSL